MGMAIMTRACVRLGTCPPECWNVLRSLLNRFQLPKTCAMAKKDLLEAAHADKKRRGDTITLIQPRALGECILRKTDYAGLAEILDWGMEG